MPLVAASAPTFTMQAYSYLTPEAVYMRQSNESDVEVLARISAMDPQERTARRTALLTVKETVMAENQVVIKRIIQTAMRQRGGAPVLGGARRDCRGGCPIERLAAH